jgi:ABC-2 type transport system permease protein
MNKHWVTFKKYRFLLEDLIVRDLKVKYRRSILGLIWSILNPLLMMLVITAVFANIFRFDVAFFPVYYLTGATLFNFVVESTNTALSSIIRSAPLIKKVYIPKYLFPLEKALFAFVNLFFSLIAVLIVILVLRMPLYWTIVLVPVPLVYTLVFAIGLSLILAAVNVFFRDIEHLYTVWTTAWLYLTHIIYPLEILPPLMQRIVRLNPLYYYIEAFRQIVMLGQVPSLSLNAICFGTSAVSLIAGLLIFRRLQDRFILYI